MAGNVISTNKRAKNIVWTAAGDYTFSPQFLAFRQNGEPDFYMNAIIGYAHKWYGSPEMDAFVSSFRNSVKRDTYDGLLWFALEHCAYEREVAGRPLLKELRVTYATDFLAEAYLRSKQQWMAQDSTVYALQESRCKEILGRKPGLLNARERLLFEKLTLPGDLNVQELIREISAVLRQVYRYSEQGDTVTRFSRAWLQVKNKLTQRLPVRTVRTEVLHIGASGESAMTDGGGGQNGLDPRRTKDAPERDHAYLEACFGRPLYTPQEEAQLNERYCSGAHGLCRLYFTGGDRETAQPQEASVRLLIRDAQRQREANERHYQANRRIYEAAMTRLREQVKNAMLVYPQALPARVRSGRLHTPDLWRGVYLKDERVFQETYEEEQPEFSVDLLLDGSSSCLDCQEMIAAQGYVVAKSLQACQIPVQVCAFSSLRGYTVLRRFFTYRETNRNEQIFDYFASGWNRDGLALRGISHLMEGSGCRNRILIVLTDACPNDDRKLLAEEGKGLLAKDYSDLVGRTDTAREVRQLRKDGVRVMAILNGKYGSPEGAKEIYGKDFTSIEEPRQLAEAAGRLIQKQIRELSAR